MEFICLKDTIFNNLNIVLKAVCTKTSLPILECIFICATNNTFQLIAYDLELGIKSNLIDCTVTQEGSVCLNAKMFADIIRHLPDDIVKITSDENNITHISSGKSKFRISGQPSDQFPTLPQIIKNNEYILDALIFKNMIKQTIFSVSSDESKIVLTGLFFDIKKQILNIVGVDGFRIALRKFNLTTSFKDISCIIPSKTMYEISKIISAENDQNLTICFTDTHVLFETNSCTIISRIIDGDFMDYEQVFTKDYDTSIVVDRLELISSLERSCIIAKENKKNPVNLKILSDILVITSINEIGDTYEEISIECEGKNLNISFNPKYLIDVLKAIDEKKCNLLFTTELSPCIIKALDADDHNYLVLPLRIR